MSCNVFDALEPQGFGATCWIDTAAAVGGDTTPYDVHVRLAGTRLDEDGSATPETFASTQTFRGLVPGSGPVALSTRTNAITPGTWRVAAEITAPGDALGSATPARKLEPITGSTAYLPALPVTAAGVRPGSWPTLVGVGALVALGMQWALASSAGLPALRLLVLSVIACLVGLAGAKVYSYFLTPRGNRRLLTAGLCIQGFVLAAIGTIVLGSALLDIPVLPMLDVSAPGLLFGMAIGRVGCFLGGCCAGRPTASRWGLWSTDRSIGLRRIPVQLFESAFTALVATATLLVLLTQSAPLRGLIFLAGISTYTAGRQLLFLLRSEPRRTSHGRVLVLATAGTTAVIAGLLVAAG